VKPFIANFTLLHVEIPHTSSLVESLREVIMIDSYQQYELVQKVI